MAVDIGTFKSYPDLPTDDLFYVVLPGWTKEVFLEHRTNLNSRYGEISVIFQLLPKFTTYKYEQIAK